jgi:glycosyltransferase involved in cell wall biosynthesis
VIQIVSTMRNEAQNIPLFVEMIVSLRKESCLDLNAVIVDNGSTDETREVITSLGESPFVKFLRNPVGSSYGAGIEKAIAGVTSPYILIIPADLQFERSDILKLLRFFCAKVQSIEAADKVKVAVFTLRKHRTDGTFLKFRGQVWRKLVTWVLKIDSSLDPASQLKIIPTPQRFNAENRNFIWDIEVLLWAMEIVTDYEICEVGFKPRNLGESSISKNPIRASLLAIIGLVRLSHKLKSSNSAGGSHFIR